MTRLRGLLLLLAIGAVTGSAVGVTWAAFSATTDTSGSSYSAKRVTSATRTLPAWSLSDVSGAAVDKTDPLAYDDALFMTTKGLSIAGATNKYVAVDFAALAPAGLDPTSVSLDVDFSDNGGGTGESSCFWFDVVRRSTGTVIGTHGTEASPTGCESTLTINRTSTALSEVTSAAIANDLRVRLYVRNIKAGSAMRLHKVVLSFKRYGRTFPLHDQQVNDQSDGTALTTVWALVAAGDSQTYTTANNWGATFATTKYLAAKFPSSVPSAATVTGATLRHAYKSNTGGATTCWYAEAYSAGALIGTYGSSGSPIGCNSTTSFVTQSVSMPEVNTGARANDLTVRIYESVSGAGKSIHDLVDVAITWSLPSTGCVDPGTLTLTATADSWSDQNAPTSVTGGTATTLAIRSQSGSRNRRAFVLFSLPSSFASDCTLQSATLRLTTTAVQGSRTVQVARAATAWTEAALNWNTQPAATGTTTSAAIGAAIGTVNVSVTSAVTSLLAGSNYGFVLTDSVEDSATAALNVFSSREGTTPPQLLLTVG